VFHASGAEVYAGVMNPAKLIAVLALVVAVAPSQLSLPVCDGTGARLTLATPAWLGPPVTLRVDGNPGAPFLVSAADVPAITAVPGLGNVCLAFDASLQVVWSGQLSALGSAATTFAVSDVPFWQSFTTFLQGAAADPSLPSGYALTNTLRVDFETPDTFVAVGPMTVGRGSSPACLLPTGHVFFSGGSTYNGGDPLQSTEIYHPVIRQFSAGPQMSLPRRLHTATVLLDGRVLVVGGFTGYPNSVTAACELFDPVSLTFTPAASLPAPRAGHIAARLPDGRVLVAGGSTSIYPGDNGSWFSPMISISNATSSALLYDPAADQWTAVASPLQTPRFLAEATTLLDERVMIIGGLDGIVYLPSGQSPIPQPFPHIGTLVDVFDPATSTFLTFPSSLPATGLIGHRASTTPSGDVVVTGGPFIRKFDGSSWTYFSGIAPGGEASYHGQAVLPNGQVHVSGVRGITQFPNYAYDLCFRTAGWVPTQTASLPLPPGAVSIKHQAEIALLDGTILIAGGHDVLAGPIGLTFSAAWLYTPAP
jgi:Kelch motif